MLMENSKAFKTLPNCPEMWLQKSRDLFKKDPQKLKLPRLKKNDRMIQGIFSLPRLISTAFLFALASHRSRTTSTRFWAFSLPGSSAAFQMWCTRKDHQTWLWSGWLVDGNLSQSQTQSKFHQPEGLGFKLWQIPKKWLSGLHIQPDPAVIQASSKHASRQASWRMVKRISDVRKNTGSCAFKPWRLGTSTAISCVTGIRSTVGCHSMTLLFHCGHKETNKEIPIV